jgi:hypothetical protein
MEELGSLSERIRRVLRAVLERAEDDVSAGGCQLCRLGVVACGNG